ncbi:hypothetical protein [Zobellia nedashkovskayae]|uniref:hypothetical protein n=1 Tax=Zobellia nedashkovskayae TaxID=2779510 RepID=UPI00188B35CA|nr:hypothetical protein [Zobellia nedashkovskayae]
MKQGPKVLALLFLLFTQSCKNDDCETIACFTPPTPFEFELVDITSGENVFTNGTFSSSDIKVIDVADESAIDFFFIAENDYNILQINTVGWETEIVTYSIQIASEPVFELYVDAERKSNTCCASTEYKEVRIDNADFELDEDTGIYKIRVE